MKRKIKDVIVGVLFVTLLLCASAIDNQKILIPVIGTVVSLFGLFALVLTEEELWYER